MKKNRLTFDLFFSFLSSLSSFTPSPSSTFFLSFFFLHLYLAPVEFRRDVAGAEQAVEERVRGRGFLCVVEKDFFFL